MTLFTIGHSRRSADAFVSLIEIHRVQRLADVRRLPRSGRSPHFSAPALGVLLAAHHVEYRHFPELGGLRRPRADSRNTAWQDSAFRGYADHMATATFARAVAGLLDFASGGRTAIMCAEADCHRCHRSLLADALTINGASVYHIVSPAVPQQHTLSPFARLEDGVVTYPGLV